MDTPSNRRMDLTDELEPGSSDEECEKPENNSTRVLEEKHQAQRKILDKWLMTAAGQAAIKASRSKNSKAGTGATYDLSDQPLMAKQQEEVQIVKNPREYQIELFERAKEDNLIAVLDTGSGKTLIAVLLLKWTIDRELESRVAGDLPKLSFFLVASVTLVYQQYSVLECNLDHNIARFCGADNVESWDKKRWEKVFRDNMVIVCTADILLSCLFRSYISIQQINLLIFDEAHHAKKNHPYARIIKDHYLAQPNKTLRPRIFGMTASPFDSKNTDVLQAATELERLLSCRIATTDNMSLAQAVKKPHETLQPFNALPSHGFETPLLNDLMTRYGEVDVFRHFFDRAVEIARELGAWCADTFLLQSFSPEKETKYEAQITQRFHGRQGGRNVAELDEAVKEMKTAINYVRSQHPTLHAQTLEHILSSKVRALRECLNREFTTSPASRCIVFVERRYTARLLHQVFQKIGTKQMRSGFLIGAGGSNPEENSFTFRQQVITLLKFRKGEINCLFATSVAEEGLDIPDCNLVIRFDMYKTMIQYVQSRGRARLQGSKFIHFVENGNTIHKELVQDVRNQENLMRQFCKQLPEESKLRCYEDTIEELLEKEKNLRVHTVPSTGAKLTYGNALGILANFVSSIPTENNEPQHPTYVVSIKGSKFIGEVMLPGHAAVRSAVGQVRTKKSLAKRSAAFQACVELRKKNYLDEHLRSTLNKSLPAMANAMIAVSAKANTQYPMRPKPSIWAESRGSIPTELWLMIVQFPADLMRLHRPIALLTRTRMPPFPEFPVFLDGKQAAMIRSTIYTQLLSVTEPTLDLLTQFTLRVFRDVFSKTYGSDIAQMSYWLAPVRTQDFAQNSLPHFALDWDLLNEVRKIDRIPWTPQTPNEILLNRFLYDRWDGERKFYSVSINNELKQSDPPPPDVAKVLKSEMRNSILDYSVSLWKESRKRATWVDGQPVIEAYKINTTRRNMLAPPTEKEANGKTLRTRACIVPEPLGISTLPPAFAASCFVWPAIIHRLESYLVSMEACSIVGIDCGPAFALAAFTKDSDNSGEHDQQQVNVRHGMGENYERLEFIGDTFLKTATTISTFIVNPNENEFEFHVRRMEMLCNKNLFETACELKLYEYIRTVPFSRRLWYPEGLVLLDGKGVKQSSEKKAHYHQAQSHALSQKTIADVSEALIGAAYLTSNRLDSWQPEYWENAVAAVTKLVNSKDHRMLKWADYSAAYSLPAYQTSDVTAIQRHLAQKVETEHVYHFKYPRLLYSAFLHPSVPYVHEQIPDYQRLEFLGDALLDQASITYLFYAYPEKDPQWLTEHKMAMVSNRFLGAVCVSIGFHKHLRHHSSALQHQIHAYATELLEAKRKAGPDRSRDFWTSVSDPPKCLPDIVESYVGAMFIDSNFDYGQVQRFFDEHIKLYFEDMTLYDSFANNHPCTHLHNVLQSRFGCADYQLMTKSLPATSTVSQLATTSAAEPDEDEEVRQDVVAVVMIHGEIMAHSVGKSGRYGRVRAAQRTLRRIEEMRVEEFRERFGCACKERCSGGNVSAGTLAGFVTNTSASGHGMGVDAAVEEEGMERIEAMMGMGMVVDEE